MKVLETRPVSMPEAKKILTSREKAGELGYEQKLAMEHLNKFTKLEPGKAEKFIEDISSVLRMSPETLMQLTNIMPQNADELRLIFAKEKFSLREEEMGKILEVVKKYS